jgi:cytochrome c biogenesis protein CcdA/thiol-disulfide isomerase/thioredoxin
MLLLLAFAVLAGAATGLTPCVLPVLPGLLAASSTGGRRRPLAIVVGLVTTMVLVIVGLASLLAGLGLGDAFLRNFAIVVLALFGLSLLVPPLSRALERPLAAASRFGPRSSGTGVLSGLAVGGALGVVCAPCAGPILGAVISVSATRGASSSVVVLAVAFGLGLGLTLLLIASGWRRIAGRLLRAGRHMIAQRALGAVMLLTAFALYHMLDVRLTTALAGDFPSFLVSPTEGLESSGAIRAQLDKIHGPAKFDSKHATPAQRSAGASVGVAIPGVTTPPLPNLGPAPAFVGTQRWFNTPGGRPLTLASLRGHVVLVDFWTYTCINCIRTFPYLKALYAKYNNDGFEIVGVHTPEFSFEHDASNVAAAISQNGLRYPVVQDNNYATWNAYGNQSWPADYLIDGNGEVRYTHFGEGDYAQGEAAVRELLAQAGRARVLGVPAHAHGLATATALATPETYLGARRAEGFLPALPIAGLHRYPGVQHLPLNAFSFAGLWREEPERATAVSSATITGNIHAQKVYLVLSSSGDRPRQIRVLLDGRPITPQQSGTDVHHGVLTVRSQRLYNLVSLSSAQTHTLTLTLSPGVSGYAFTFG